MERNEPYIISVEEGQRGAICTCGHSANLPFCDGTHKGSEKSPNVVVFEKTGNVAICGCGRSAGHPFCDGSHKQPRP